MSRHGLVPAAIASAQRTEPRRAAWTTAAPADSCTLGADHCWRHPSWNRRSRTLSPRFQPGPAPKINVAPISGGLTNRNFRVTVDGTSHFVRIPGVGTDLLAIDRGNELANTIAAAETGVGARALAAIYSQLDDAQRAVTAQAVTRLKAAIDAVPKPLAWRMRDRVGNRRQRWTDVDEVR